MSQRIWGVIILAIGCGFLWLPVKTTAVSKEENRNVLLAASATVILSGQTTPVAADTAYVLVNGRREVWDEAKSDIQTQFYKDVLSLINGLYRLAIGQPSGYSDFYSAEAKLYTIDLSNPFYTDTAYIVVNPRIGIQGDVYSAEDIMKGFKSVRDNLWLSAGAVGTQASKTIEKYQIDSGSLLSTKGKDLAGGNIQAIFGQRGRVPKNTSNQPISSYNQQLWFLNYGDEDDDNPATAPAAGNPSIEGGIWKINGNLVMEKPSSPTEIKLVDRGTIWVAGNLKINADLKYFDDKSIAGFYVEKDVVVDGAVGEINGIFLVRGKIIIDNGNKPLKMNGVFVADSFQFGQRQLTDTSQFEIMVRRDSRVNTVPPPGFSQIDWPELKEAAP